MSTINAPSLVNLDLSLLFADAESALCGTPHAPGRRPIQQPGLQPGDSLEAGRSNVEAIMQRAPIDISTMSVEDIMFWLMISIQDAYNKHIQAKAEEVQGAQTTLDGAVGAGESERQQYQSSLDQHTQALQRLLTKRDQFVTMFQQMLKKYDESVAKVWQ